LIRKIKRAIEKVNRGYLVAGVTGVSVITACVPAFAIGTADAGVTTAFTSAGDNIVATIESVAPFAIGIFLAVMGFKYGKKIFKIVAS